MGKKHSTTDQFGTYTEEESECVARCNACKRSFTYPVELEDELAKAKAEKRRPNAAPPAGSPCCGADYTRLGVKRELVSFEPKKSAEEELAKLPQDHPIRKFMAKKPA